MVSDRDAKVLTRFYEALNEGDFSVRLPVPVLLSSRLERFGPEIVHSHHPFLLGDTALRVAARYDRPLVFTARQQFAVN